jgi:hypothetical protein
MRQALELSMTTAPACAAMGPYSRDTLAPALKSAIPTPANEVGFSSSTVISPPANGSFAPALLPLASATTRLAGNLRCSSVFSISRPTAPVAPTTATTCDIRLLTVAPARSSAAFPGARFAASGLR